MISNICHFTGELVPVSPKISHRDLQPALYLKKGAYHHIHGSWKMEAAASTDGGKIGKSAEATYTKNLTDPCAVTQLTSYFQGLHTKKAMWHQKKPRRGRRDKNVRSSSVIEDSNNRLVFARTLCNVMPTSNGILLAFFLHLPELSTPLSPNRMKQQQQQSTLASYFFCRRRSACFRSTSRVAATTKRGTDAQCQLQQVCKNANRLTS